MYGSCSQHDRYTVNVSLSVCLRMSVIIFSLSDTSWLYALYTSSKYDSIIDTSVTMNDVYKTSYSRVLIMKYFTSSGPVHVIRI